MAFDFKVIKKQDEGRNVQRIIKDPWWLKPAKRFEQRAQNELKKIYEAHHHIICTCNEARMFVRHLDKKYCLVNHPELGRHSTKCPFYTVISGKISPHEFGGEVEYKEIMTFCLHEKSSESEKQEKVERVLPSEESKKEPPKRHKLLRLLYQLSHDSYNYVYSGLKIKSPNRTVALAKLHDAANSIIFGEYKLKDYLYYGDKGRIFAERKLSGIEDKNWKGPGRPHCFILEIVETITREDNKLTLDGIDRDYERIIWPGLQATPGPYIVLSSLVKEGQDGDDRKVVRHSACVKPVVSHDVLMPIDSDYERTFAKAFIDAINRNLTTNMHASDGDKFKCSLMKPLKPMESPDGEFLLPDFIVQCKVDQKVVRRDIVEVMGFDDSSYLERKKRLIPKMQGAFRGDRVVEIVKDSHVDIARLIGEIFYSHK